MMNLNLSKKMRDNLPKKIVSLLRFIGKMAHEKNCTVFIVGGFVRDLIMGVKNFDIDIVVEGDAIEFAKHFAGRVRGSLVTHEKFGTATVVMPWGLKDFERFRVDMATARREKYERPAALPHVEFSSLRDDLYRRDFTINAMAVALNKDDFGQLIDFFDGQRHLRERIISVLHKDSFIDDPTRIFRAVRFEQRFGFKIDRPTEILIKTAINKDMFRGTSNIRMRNELILMLKEKDPLKVIKRMHQLDELKFIHPNIKIEKDLTLFFKSIAKICQWYKGLQIKKNALDSWLMYLMGLFENLDKKAVRGLCNKFAFKRLDKARIISYKKNGEKVLKFLSQKKPIAPSQVYKRLHPLSHEVILLLLAKTKNNKAKKAMTDFLLAYNNVKSKITGDDLRKLGFKPGPALGTALKKIRYARIDGKIKTKKDELAYAQRMLE